MTLAGSSAKKIAIHLLAIGIGLFELYICCVGLINFPVGGGHIPIRPMSYFIGLGGFQLA